MLYLGINKTGREGAQTPVPALTKQPNEVAVMADQKVLNFCNSTKEVWKDIPNTDGFYQISNKGRVRSWQRYGVAKGKSDTPHIKAFSQGSSTYYQVNLSNNGELYHELVHRLVAKAFVPNPDNKPCVNHKDGDKLNNVAPNLEWVTYSENNQHAADNNLAFTGELNAMSRLTEKEVLDIRNTYRLGCFTHKEIAKAFNISRTLVTLIINRKRWKHL